MITPTEQDVLRESLERTIKAFFIKRHQKKSKIIVANARPKDPEIDAVGVLAVMSGMVGDLIAGAPEDMRDSLFFGFSENVVDVAGIRGGDDCACDECMPVATETMQ